jgi:hypothetical protein
MDGPLDLSYDPDDRPARGGTSDLPPRLIPAQGERRGFWAQAGTYSAGLYSFTEVMGNPPSSSGAWTFATGGVVGSAAEANGNTTVPAGAFVWVEPTSWNYGSGYTFEYDNGGTGGTTTYTNQTITYVNDVFNYSVTPSTTNYNVGQTFNFYAAATWNLSAPFTVNVSALTVYTIGGPGYLSLTAPTEVCAGLYWCCGDLPLLTGTNSDLPLDGKVVYDLVPSAGGSTLDGLLPSAFGAPLNTGPVTAATNAGPIVLTVPGWTTTPAVGSVVVVSGILGNTAANGTFTVQASTATTLTLDGSLGNAAFLPSPNSAVQACGPRLVVLNNASSRSLPVNGVTASLSKPFSRIRLPPAYVPQVTLAPGDSLTLWWDACDSFQWCVLACTVDLDTSSASLSSGSAALAADWLVPTSAWGDSGVSVALPAAGTYLLTAQVTGNYITSSPPTGTTGSLAAKLVDATAAADVPHSPVIVACLPVVPTSGDPTAPQQGTGTISVLYAVTGASTIKLYGAATGGNNGSAFRSSPTAPGTGGCTVLCWLKVA